MNRPDGRRGALRGALLGLAAAITFGGMGTVAFAQDDDDDELRNAWADLVVNKEPILSESQFAQLNNLAYQAAVTNVCEGYVLDQAAFAKGLSDAMAEQPQQANGEQIRQWEAAVLFRLGANYGLFLAEGNEEPDEFCASAAELRADSEVPHFWQGNH